MAQLSGLYGPAVALAGIGDSLSDMMKTWANMKIAEARMDVENKQMDLNLARVMGELEVSKAKAGLETAKLASEERARERGFSLQEAKLGYDVEHQRELEAQGRSQLALNQDTLNMAKQLHRFQVKALERQQEEITGEQFLKESSGMLPIMRDYIKIAAPDLLAAKRPRAEWADMLKIWNERNLKYAIAQSMYSLAQTREELLKEIDKLPKTPEYEPKAEALLFQLANVMTDLQKMTVLMEKDDDSAIKLAGTMAKDPVTGEVDEENFKKSYAAIMQIKRQLHGAMQKQTKPEDIKGFITAYGDARKVGVEFGQFAPFMAKQYVTAVRSEYPNTTDAEFEKQVEEYTRSAYKKYGPQISQEMLEEVKNQWKETKPKPNASLGKMTPSSVIETMHGGFLED